MQNEILNITISSNYFKGFYESIYNNSDMFIDLENELKNEIQDNIKDDINISIEYDYINFNNYKTKVSETFIYNYIDEILYNIPNDLLNKDYFLFKPVKETLYIYSPKYYNYSTDEVYIDIETNYKTLETIKNYILNLTGAKEYIKNKYAYYDGFISFLPNNINTWKETSITEAIKNNMITYICDILLYCTNKEILNNINYTTSEEVSYFEYIEPLIYCNNQETANTINKNYNYKTILI